MAAEKILVVDDDTNICELLRLYLEKEGYEVVLAHNGADAVTAFREQSPSLMLLDIMLPVLDGWQVCREVRKFSDKPIIMLTAKGETFDKVLGFEPGTKFKYSLCHCSLKLFALLNYLCIGVKRTFFCSQTL